MRARLAIVVALLTAIAAWAQAAPFGGGRPKLGNATPPALTTLFQYCSTVNGGQGVIAPCPSAGAAPTAVARTTTGTTVVKFNGFPTIPGGQSQINIKFFGPASGTNFLLTNVCVGGANGSKAQDFTSSSATCNGSNGCTKLCGSGATACSSIPATGLSLSGAVAVNAPFSIAFDSNSGTYNSSYTKLNSTGSSTFNYFPANSIGATNYNSYRKSSVNEACSTVKGSGYTANEGLSGTNVIEQIAQVQVQ